MYFYVDTRHQSVAAFKSMGDAARAVLDSNGVSLPAGADPVKEAQRLLGDNGALLNLSAAFSSIAESGDQAAQELADQFRAAVDQFYG